MLPQSLPPSGPPPKPTIQWTIPFIPGVNMAIWVDGSIRVTLTADKAELVTQHFREVVKAMEVGTEMIKNPPKKCTGCRGKGQIIVKTGMARETQVCPSCNGSGQKIHRPADPAKLMTRNVGHVPPLSANPLPHQTHVDPQIDNSIRQNPPAAPVEQVESPSENLREVDAGELHDFD